ncbi:endonuclease/exonuclease/phosphatase family protein [Glycomyces sp. L485]|uniref:endonuclease/exonuclease/phosphatase family protein n=1 Tax=Glycomyces sp. L485 TaxID=2909235 RepID=UPI001F4B206B|nr:endonuclease/exonuclease/phosphatase family protein [Glycomyces sp. L485]MCH7230211.1 endonuclease/exonuclease/phosphatase family protein [Glycomyces sp. L485]
MVDAEDQPEPDRDLPLIGAARAPGIHVMTYNLRTAGGRRPHSWAERRPLVGAVLEREHPTVLCTQEGRFRQLLDVKSDLDGYDWLHLGRGGGSRSESTAIFWDESRLAPIEYDHLWLSRRPNVIGSRSWGSRTVRMLTWIHFEDLEAGRDFYVVDNHLDHRSERARRKGAGLNLDVLARFGAPAIVAGDFNCGADSKVHRMLTAAGLTDAWDAAAERLTPAWGTFNRWRTDPAEGDRIDWILVQPGIEVHQAAVNTYAEDGLTPSDHWPVQALLSLRGAL